VNIVPGPAGKGEKNHQKCPNFIQFISHNCYFIHFEKLLEKRFFKTFFELSNVMQK
jgi:hypothetical protein